MSTMLAVEICGAIVLAGAGALALWLWRSDGTEKRLRFRVRVTVVVTAITEELVFRVPLMLVFSSVSGLAWQWILIGAVPFTLYALAFRASRKFFREFWVSWDASQKVVSVSVAVIAYLATGVSLGYIAVQTHSLALCVVANLVLGAVSIAITALALVCAGMIEDRMRHKRS